MDSRSELDKMLGGDLYYSPDPELDELRKRARRLTRKYNLCGVDEAEERLRLLGELFGSLGVNPEIEPPFHCDFGSHIHVGDNFYMNSGGVMLDCAVLAIGHNVRMGPHVQLCAAHHPADPKTRAGFYEYASPIAIGDDVWLGAGVVVMPGVSVGARSVIGAGSLVTKDIPSDVIAFGNPCAIHKPITYEERD